jgi:hypothetical protein
MSVMNYINKIKVSGRMIRKLLFLISDSFHLLYFVSSELCFVAYTHLSIDDNLHIYHM